MTVRRSLPGCPDKQTFLGTNGMSQMCQKATSEASPDMIEVVNRGGLRAVLKARDHRRIAELDGIPQLKVAGGRQAVSGLKKVSERAGGHVSTHPS